MKMPTLIYILDTQDITRIVITFISLYKVQITICHKLPSEISITVHYEQPEKSSYKYPIINSVLNAIIACDRHYIFIIIMMFILLNKCHIQ